MSSLFYLKPVDNSDLSPCRLNLSSEIRLFPFASYFVLILVSPKYPEGPLTTKG